MVCCVASDTVWVEIAERFFNTHDARKNKKNRNICALKKATPVASGCSNRTRESVRKGGAGLVCHIATRTTQYVRAISLPPPLCLHYCVVNFTEATATLSSLSRVPETQSTPPGPWHKILEACMGWRFSPSSDAQAANSSWAHQLFQIRRWTALSNARTPVSIE